MIPSSQQRHQCSNVEIYTDNLCESDTPGNVFVRDGAGSRLQLQQTRSCEVLRTLALRDSQMRMKFGNARLVEVSLPRFFEFPNYGGRRGPEGLMAILAVMKLQTVMGTLMDIVSDIFSRYIQFPVISFQSVDKGGSPEHTDTWFRYLIKMTQHNSAKDEISFSWLKFNIYTRWEAVTKHTFLVVFDPKPSVKKEILSSIVIPEPAANQPSGLEDPYWVHVRILQHVIRLQDAAVWAIRDLVRAMETSRAAITKSTGANLDYERLHEIARHAIHVSETTALSIKTTEHILALHCDFIDQLSFKLAEHRSKYTYSQIHKQLYFFEHMMHSLALRSTATRDRLLNEIHLAFNVVSQFDSHASVAIGRATQYDSYSMRSVAFLTLTFLPATFVSALFSMSFFNYDPDSGWIVSEKIWLYFAIAGPLTGISLMLWLAWQKLFPPESLAPTLGGYKAPSREENTASRSRATTWETVKSKMDIQAYELNEV